MIYYDPRNNVCKKVDRFTEIIYEDNNITAKNDNQTCELNQGFLYDGDNYYVFLEPVVANFNGYKVELSTLSYIEADYHSNVMAFDYVTKSNITEEPETEMVVTTSTEDYTLKPFNDSLENYKNEKSLLFSRPELLGNLFG